MKHLKILLVEDEILISELVSEFLTDLGHDVCAVETTETNAISAAHRLKPDLMIVDARLGTGSGLRALATILSTRFIPHIIVSGERLTNIEPKAGRVVLQKPYFAPDLIRAIKRAIGP